MWKAAVRELLMRFGYRIVPANRDSNSIRAFLRARPIKTVIDVGASTGETVIQWLKDYPDAMVHGIEPLPSSSAILKTLEGHYPGRFKAWNFAAGDTDGIVQMYFHHEHPTSSSMLNRSDYSTKVLPFTQQQQLINVDQRSLDSVFGSNGVALAGPVLLKLDVQGFEDRVLAGAGRVLKETEVIFSEVSIAPVYDSQCDFARFHEIATTAGFHFAGFVEQFHLKDGSPVYVDVVYFNDRFATGTLHV